MELEQVVNDLAAALVMVDQCGVGFKQFQPGVGPYGEPQLLAAVAHHLNNLPAYDRTVRTKRTPDLLIPGQWALEVKLARPFGDNGRQAENWSVNLLHPYEGNVSLIGDCLKLQRLGGVERKAVVVVGYEHTPPKIALAPLIDAFELVATKVVGVRIGPRVQIRSVRAMPPRASTITGRVVGSIVPCGFGLTTRCFVAAKKLGMCKTVTGSDGSDLLVGSSASQVNRLRRVHPGSPGD